MDAGVSIVSTVLQSCSYGGSGYRSACCHGSL